MLDSRELERVKADLEGSLSTICRTVPIASVIARLDSLPVRVSLDAPRSIVFETVDRIKAEHGPDAAGKYCKLVVLTLFADFAERTANLRLTPKISDYYIKAMAIAVDTARSMADADYLADPNFFLKDLRLASQLSLPFGAQAVDFRAWLPQSFYRNNGKRDNLSALWFVASRLRGMGPLFRVHTDTRNLSHFNEAGRIDFYHDIADLLELYPEVRGVVGTSWFYDPQLEKVSPHLSYLRKIPTENGAYLRKDEESDDHTALALSKSKSRQKFHDEGLYRPCCHTIVWARRDLIAWSKNSKRNMR